MKRDCSDQVNDLVEASNAKKVTRMAPAAAVAEDLVASVVRESKEPDILGGLRRCLIPHYWGSALEGVANDDDKIKVLRSEIQRMR